MSDLAVAIGLALAIEGALYALLPGLMKRGAALAVATPDDRLRTGGVVAAAIGVALVWLVRG